MTINWVTRTSTYCRVDMLRKEFWVYRDLTCGGFVVRCVPDAGEWYLLAAEGKVTTAVHAEHIDAYNAANRYIERQLKETSQ